MLGDVSDTRRIGLCRGARIRLEHVGRGEWQTRGDQQNRRRFPLYVWERLDELAASGDKSRAARQEERHVRSKRRRQSGLPPGSQDGAPGRERGFDGRRGVAAAASQSGGDGDSLGQPDGQRRGRRPGRSGLHLGTGSGNSPEYEVVRFRRQWQAGDPQRILSCARRRLGYGQGIAECQRDHHGVEGVISILAATDNGQRKVQLCGREAYDVDVRSGGTFRRHRPIPPGSCSMATRRTSHSSTERVWGRRSLSIPAAARARDASAAESCNWRDRTLCNFLRRSRKPA